MKLEDQVCSLELAKMLKELGLKVKSVFCYFHSKRHERIYLEFHSHIDNYEKDEDFVEFVCYAYTVAELGEMLPGLIKIDKTFFYLSQDCDKHPYYEDMMPKTKEIYSDLHHDHDNEANARAKMIIYLLEEGLIKNEKT